MKLKTLRAKLSMLISILILSVYGCNSSPQTIALLVDTSGSMNKNDAIEKVKEIASSKINRFADGENEIILYRFDTVVEELYRGTPTEENSNQLVNIVNALDPAGQWTYLEKALNKAFQDIEKSGLERKKIIMFTDGLNDPPPDGQVGNFNSLVEKIQKQLKGKGGLYIIDVAEQGWFSPTQMETIKEVILTFLQIILFGLLLLALLIAGVKIRKIMCTFPDYYLVVLDDNGQEAINSYELNEYRRSCNTAVRISQDIDLPGFADNAFIIISERNGLVKLQALNSSIIYSRDKTANKNEIIAYSSGTVFEANNYKFKITSE